MTPARPDDTGSGCRRAPRVRLTNTVLLVQSAPPTLPDGWARGSALAHPPGRAVVADQVEERHGVNASGPSTPAPDHTPAASSSSAITGLTAVCQTTPAHRTRASTTRCRPRGTGRPARGSPSLPVPCTHSPAQVLPVIRSPSVAGSGRQAATTSRGDDLRLDRPSTGSVRSRPSLCSVLQHLDELVAQAVLEGDPLGVDPARHQQHLFVLDVHALDRPDALGEVEHLRLAERLRW